MCFLPVPHPANTTLSHIHLVGIIVGCRPTGAKFHVTVPIKQSEDILWIESKRCLPLDEHKPLVMAECVKERTHGLTSQ